MEEGKEVKKKTNHGSITICLHIKCLYQSSFYRTLMFLYTLSGVLNQIIFKVPSR